MASLDVGHAVIRSLKIRKPVLFGYTSWVPITFHWGLLAFVASLWLHNRWSIVLDQRGVYYLRRLGYFILIALPAVCYWLTTRHLSLVVGLLVVLGLAVGFVRGVKLLKMEYK